MGPQLPWKNTYKEKPCSVQITMKKSFFILIEAIVFTLCNYLASQKAIACICISTFYFDTNCINMIDLNNIDMQQCYGNGIQVVEIHKKIENISKFPKPEWGGVHEIGLKHCEYRFQLMFCNMTERMWLYFRIYVNQYIASNLYTYISINHLVDARLIHSYKQHS